MKYQRVLLKLSGEALKDQDNIYDGQKLNRTADQLISMVKDGLQLGIVVGGGNIWRGKLSDELGIEQISGDYMGMMATVMNALALQAVINQKGYAKVVVYSALKIENLTKDYNFYEARDLLVQGYIVIFASGTGYAYFTTDTTAIIRGIEVKADAILMAKNGVSGVYDSDPKQNPEAKLFTKLSYDDIIAKNLHVMDQSAALMAKQAKMKIVVFDMQQPDSLTKIIQGSLTSTIIEE